MLNRSRFLSSLSLSSRLFGWVTVLLLCTIVVWLSACTEDKPFVTTWETTTPNESLFIPTVPGREYVFTIDWGDGTIEEVTGIDPDPSHTYGDPGSYTISINGTFPHLFMNAGDHLDGDQENALKLKTIDQWGTIEWKSMKGAFAGASNMAYRASDVPDLSNVTDMREMFLSAEAFNQDIGDWDVSSATNMAGMFRMAKTFNQDIGDWDVSNVTNMSDMFFFAEAFNQDIGEWDVSNVTNMHMMFTAAKSFNQDIGEWDVSNVTTMHAMFWEAEAFNQDIGEWNVSNVTDMRAMFLGAYSFNRDLSSWNVSNSTYTSRMFTRAYAFEPWRAPPGVAVRR